MDQYTTEELRSMAAWGLERIAAEVREGLKSRRQAQEEIVNDIRPLVREIATRRQRKAA